MSTRHILIIVIPTVVIMVIGYLIKYRIMKK
jgi:hypothetical protein